MKRRYYNVMKSRSSPVHLSSLRVAVITALSMILGMAVYLVIKSLYGFGPYITSEGLEVFLHLLPISVAFALLLNMTYVRCTQPKGNTDS